MDLVGRDIGAYRVLSLLGRGGTAEVYKAFHPALKREVALKMLLQEVSHDAEWVKRFQFEAELLGRLDHPHILPIYDAGEHEGRPFLVMKYMEDTSTLRSQLQGQPWPVNRVVKVVAQVADALDAAHKAGVVHRDIKPSNILVTADLRCSVFDFGIAKPFRRGGAVTTGSDHIVGTPEFMSPEQCKGERIDHRSDIYSLGVMTYQMLAGHVPFSAETAVGILMKHLTEPLPLPPKGVALPPAMNAVLRKAMAREPRERFATAGEFAESLSQAADQRATVTLHAAEIRKASIPTLKIPAWVRRMRSREARLAASGALLAAAMALGGYAFWSVRSERARQGPVLSARGSELAPPPGPVQSTAPEAPGSAPDEAPAGTPPSAAADRARALATLEIASRLPATVRIDGNPGGTAPGVVSGVRPGRHRIVLEAGDRREEKSVIVTPGSIQRLRFDFPEPSAPVDAGSTRPAVPVSASRSEAELSSPPPEIRQWSGYLTDEDCGTKGGTQGTLHFRCAERCIRDGKRPMLYSRGKLFHLDGFEAILLEHDQPVRFRAWQDGNTLRVVPRSAGGAATDSRERP